MSGPEIKEVSAEEEDRRKEWLEKMGRQGREGEGGEGRYRNNGIYKII